MNVLKSINFLFTRFRYPVSLPEDIASDLGIPITNALKFEDFIISLTDIHCRPAKLIRLMSRESAEAIFRLAIRKERFTQNSLFSYYFKRGWIEFNLEFDEHSRLRRLYICHKDLKTKHEIPL